MTLYAIMLVSMMCLFHSTEFAHKLFLKLNKSHSSFLNNAEDCPTDRNDYWFSHYPEHCVPPPTDHGAVNLQANEAAASLCVYVHHIESLHGLKFRKGKECLNP